MGKKVFTETLVSNIFQHMEDMPKDDVHFNIKVRGGKAFFIACAPDLFDENEYESN